MIVRLEPPSWAGWRTAFTSSARAVSILIVVVLAGTLLRTNVSAQAPVLAREDASTTTIDSSSWASLPVADGVCLRQRHYPQLYGGPQFISVLQVNRCHPELKIRVAASIPPDEPATPLDQLAENVGAIAAINGGFMPGDPYINVGIVKAQRNLLPYLAQDPQPSLGFAGSGALGIDRHERVLFRTRETDAWQDDWPDVDHALAGGHMLLTCGQINPRLSQIADELPEGAHANKRHPRTAVALAGKQYLLLVTVDGRHSGKATGMSLFELAEYLQGLGCCEALNLDGGGSTTLWTQSLGIVNHPSDNGQFDRQGARPIRTALVVMHDD